MCDVKNKIIISYRIYMKRDTFSTIDVFYSVLRKLKRIFFIITQVIDLTDDDPISKEHRLAKQIIERLNRTFKYSYAKKEWI